MVVLDKKSEGPHLLGTYDLRRASRLSLDDLESPIGLAFNLSAQVRNHNTTRGQERIAQSQAICLRGHDQDRQRQRAACDEQHEEKCRRHVG